MKKTSSVPIAGVYLLHFTKPFGRAKHYIGWSPDIYKRVSRHKEGKEQSSQWVRFATERTSYWSGYGQVVTAI